MTETFVVQSETLREPGVSLCTKAFFFFYGQNYLFNLSRTIELLKRNSELLIVNEFPRNDTLASHTLKIYLNYKYINNNNKIHNTNLYIINKN